MTGTRSPTIKKNLNADHTGEKFGRFTIVRYHGHTDDPSGNSHSLWVVKCECGHERIVRYYTLKRSHKKCGSCDKKYGPDHYAWQGYGEISKNLHRVIKTGAADRGLPFSITVEYLWELFLSQDRKCAYTGEVLYFNKTFKEQWDRTASLDRIDSEIGYVEGNLQWVHRDINKLKKNMPDDRFLELCACVAEYRFGMTKPPNSTAS